MDNLLYEEILLYMENKFNLNLYSPNGTGKTEFVKSLINNSIYKGKLVYFSICNFLNLKEEVFPALSIVYRSIISDIDNETIKKNLEVDYFDIKKLTDFNNILQDLIGLYNLYIVIDIPGSISTINYYQRYLKRFFDVLLLYNEDINIIMISNFDLKYSEVLKIINLSSFYSLNINRLAYYYKKEYFYNASNSFKLIDEEYVINSLNEVNNENTNNKQFKSNKKLRKKTKKNKIKKVECYYLKKPCFNSNQLLGVTANDNVFKHYVYCKLNIYSLGDDIKYIDYIFIKCLKNFQSNYININEYVYSFKCVLERLNTIKRLYNLSFSNTNLFNRSHFLKSNINKDNKMSCILSNNNSNLNINDYINQLIEFIVYNSMINIVDICDSNNFFLNNKDDFNNNNNKKNIDTTFNTMQNTTDIINSHKSFDKTNNNINIIETNVFKTPVKSNIPNEYDNLISESKLTKTYNSKNNIIEDLLLTKNNITLLRDKDEIIYDTLSRNQCILLLASFCTNETQQSNDIKNFKQQKNKKRKKLNYKNNNTKRLLKSTKQKANPFSYHRLIAVYASIYGYLNYGAIDEEELDVNNINSHSSYLMSETIFDLNSLIELDFIKLFKSTEQNFIMNRKLLINFNVGVACRIALKLECRLEEFINVDNLVDY